MPPKTQKKELEIAVKVEKPAEKPVEKPVEKKTDKVAKPAAKLAVAPSVVPPLSVEIPDSDSDSHVDDADYTSILANLVQIEKLVRVTMPLIKRLQKKHERDVKNAAKVKKVKRSRDPNAPPSGFARPGPVSGELRTFLGMKQDELIARTQVAKRVSEYIKDNNLKNPDNNKEIVIDKKLATLFKVPEKTKVAFFQIQSYLTTHFIKTIPVPNA